MPEQVLKSEIVNPSDVCYRAFELMRAKQYDDAEKLLSNCLTMVSNDDVASALFHSALGVMFKLKGAFKTAWKHYERAEKLLPSDPALKLIIARLLIEEFSEHDQAIKRAKKVLEFVPHNPGFVHQACITMGLAYIGKRDKKRAVEMLVNSIVDDFKGLVTVRNIDFKLCEALLRKKWGEQECKTFLEKALAFAKAGNEEDWIGTLTRMLNVFPENPNTKIQIFRQRRIRLWRTK